MEIIALVGFIGSGKNAAGEYLVKNGFKSFSFAESLKDTCASIFCWDRALLEGDTKESREWRETVDPWWSSKLEIPNFTPRMAMQNIGTNVFRQHFDPDIWIRNIERKITLLPEDAKVVICDGRFPNELNLAHYYGGKVVRIKRGPDPEWWHTAIRANGVGISMSEDLYWQDQGTTAEASARLAMDTQFKVHESEWAWIGHKIDQTIENNGTLEELHLKVSELL